MSKETRNNGHPEVCVYEQFAYLPDSGVYPNCSDMNELSQIRLGGLSID